MILFDLDGTLIDSNGIWEQIDLDFLGRHGLAPTEEYRHTVGHSIFPVAAEFTRSYYGLPMTAEEIMAEWLEDARGAYARVPLKEGAGEFVAQCAAQGLDMALLTACEPTLCRIALERHGLAPRFRDVVLVQEMGLEKRDPEVYALACARLGVAPADCVFYEDAPDNCAAAKTAGMTVVGVYDSFYEKYRLEMEQTCDRYIERFTELLA